MHHKYKLYILCIKGNSFKNLYFFYIIIRMIASEQQCVEAI